MSHRVTFFLLFLTMPLWVVPYVLLVLPVQWAWGAAGELAAEFEKRDRK